MNAGRLIGEAGAVEGGEEEIAAAVAGKDAAGAVAAMSRRGEAENPDPCRRIPETGNRFPPIVVIVKRAASRCRHKFAVRAQPRTARAGNHIGVQLEPGAHVKGTEDVERTED